MTSGPWPIDMQNVPDNIDLLLPSGEALRGFMEQSFISPTDLKRTLRGRGIFLNRNEKEIRSRCWCVACLARGSSTT